MNTLRKSSIRDQIVNFYNSQEYGEVDTYNSNQDFFRIINSDRKELVHSDMLAWMLNVKGSHGLREYCLRKFLQTIALSADFQINKQPNNQLNMDLQKLFLFGNYEIGNVDIKREVYANSGAKGKGNYIDILVAIELKKVGSKDEFKKLDIVLENKIDSVEHGAQTKAYYDYENKKYENDKAKYIGNPIFLYLLPASTMDLEQNTLDVKRHCASEYFIYLNYQYLVTNLIEPMLKQPLEEQYKYLLHSYLKTLSRPFDEADNSSTIMATTKEERNLLVTCWDKYENLLIIASREAISKSNKRGEITEALEAIEEIQKNRKKEQSTIFKASVDIATVLISDEEKTFLVEFFKQNETLINRALNAKIEDPELPDDTKKCYNALRKQLEILAKKRRASFCFSMVKINAGTKIIFAPAEIEVTVSDDNNKIKYGEKEYTLTSFCKAFMPEGKRNNSNSYQGPAYFTYNGRTLAELRDDM